MVKSTKPLKKKQGSASKVGATASKFARSLKTAKSANKLQSESKKDLTLPKEQPPKKVKYW